MKETIILSPDKEISERLTALINLLFPEVNVFCALDFVGRSEKCPMGLHPEKSAASRAKGSGRRASTISTRSRGSVKR
jgi:hypothetical protein